MIGILACLLQFGQRYGWVVQVQTNRWNVEQYFETCTSKFAKARVHWRKNETFIVCKRTKKKAQIPKLSRARHLAGPLTRTLGWRQRTKTRDGPQTPSQRKGRAGLDQVHITRNKEAWIVTEMGFKAPPWGCGEGIKRRTQCLGWFWLAPGEVDKNRNGKKCWWRWRRGFGKNAGVLLVLFVKRCPLSESVCSFVPLGNVWQVVESVLNG